MPRLAQLMIVSFLVLGGWSLPTFIVYAEQGVTSDKIYLGSVLALKGKAQGLGQGMQNGIKAAFFGKKVHGRIVEVLFRNDFYEPTHAINETNFLIKRKIFLMIGNVGTPTAKVTLPILAHHKIPAVGFFTGAGILRPGPGPVFNYRASYIQETATVIEQAIAHGIRPEQICAYLQNDSYGMAGLIGIRKALSHTNLPQKNIKLLDTIINMKGHLPKRNGIGPVGVYKRNTSKVIPGYISLKKWEKRNGVRCKLVVTVGAYDNISAFVNEAKKHREHWIISAVSFTGANNFLYNLQQLNALDKIIMTQVVPLLNSDLPIVQSAKNVLGEQFSFESLEGFIVGRMTLHLLKTMPLPLTRQNFIQHVQQSKFNLDGIPIDFTKNGYQGSDFIVVSYPTPSGYKEVTSEVWNEFLR